MIRCYSSDVSKSKEDGGVQQGSESGVGSNQGFIGQLQDYIKQDMKREKVDNLAEYAIASADKVIWFSSNHN